MQCFCSRLVGWYAYPCCIDGFMYVGYELCSVSVRMMREEFCFGKGWNGWELGWGLLCGEIDLNLIWTGKCVMMMMITLLGRWETSRNKKT